MTDNEDHGFDIDPDDDDYKPLCDCKPTCSTWFCGGCKKRKPFCNGGDDDYPELCDECWADKQADKCGCSRSDCPCDGPKTGYMGV